MNKLNKTLRKLFKGRIRDEMKKEGLLNRFHGRVYKSLKIYDRKLKHKGNEDDV